MSKPARIRPSPAVVRDRVNLAKRLKYVHALQAACGDTWRRLFANDQRRCDGALLSLLHREHQRAPPRALRCRRRPTRRRRRPERLRRASSSRSRPSMPSWWLQRRPLVPLRLDEALAAIRRHAQDLGGSGQEPWPRWRAHDHRPSACCCTCSAMGSGTTSRPRRWGCASPTLTRRSSPRVAVDPVACQRLPLANHDHRGETLAGEVQHSAHVESEARP